MKATTNSKIRFLGKKVLIWTIFKVNMTRFKARRPVAGQVELLRT